MATRAIIDVAVNDGAFTAFAANFKKYQEALAKNPQSWDKVKASIDGSAKSFQALVTASVARQAHARTITAAETEAARQLDRQSRSWHDMARSTKDVAGNIITATRSLLRWASLTAVFSGLLGAGGLFGIERLALSAQTQRRSAAGLGVTPGQEKAFGLNLGGLVNGPGFMGAVNAALTDPAQAGRLYNIGMRRGDFEGKGTFETSLSAIEHLKTIADQTERSMLGGAYRARHLEELGISLEEFQALKDRPRGEVAGYIGKARGDVGSLNLSEDQQRAWDRFKRQLDRAGSQIETSLITGLTGLTGPLEGLSKSFQETISAFLASKELKGWIGDLGEGIKSFGDEIRKPEFQQGVKDFVADVGKLAHAVAGALRWMLGANGSPDAPSVAGPRAPDPEKQKRDDEWDRIAREKAKPGFYDNPERGPRQPYDHLFRDFWERLKSFGSGGGSAGPELLNPTGYHAPAFGPARVWETLYRPPSAGFAPQIPGGGGSNAQTAHDYFFSHGWSEAQTAGLLANIQAESGFDPSRVNQTGGDAGLMQWRGSRARQFEAFFGHKVQQGSLKEQLDFAQWELTQGPEKAHGDYLRGIREAGQAGEYVARAIERPDPNRIDIIATQRAGLARRYENQFTGGVTVRIENNTGGNAIVTASQLNAT